MQKAALASSGPRRSPQQVVCRVPGCGAPLDTGYSTKYRICRNHYNSPSLDIGGGVLGRFCQQCSKFQPHGDFEHGKQSCRAGLERHTQRRKERQARQRQLAAEKDDGASADPGGAVSAGAGASAKRGRFSEPLSAKSSSPCSSSAADFLWEQRQQRPRLEDQHSPEPPAPAAPPARQQAQQVPQQPPASWFASAAPVLQQVQQAQQQPPLSWSAAASSAQAPPQQAPQIEPWHQQLLLLSTAAAAERPSPLPAAAAVQQQQASHETRPHGWQRGSCGQPGTPGKACPASSASTISLDRQECEEPCSSPQQFATSAPPPAPEPAAQLAQAQAQAPVPDMRQDQLLSVLQGTVALLQGVLQAELAAAPPAAASSTFSAATPPQPPQLQHLPGRPTAPTSCVATAGPMAAASLAALRRLAAEHTAADVVRKQLAAQRPAPELQLLQMLSRMQR